MKEKLKELLENAYSPVYHYPVSAIVEMKDGECFYGVNVETMSQGAGSCAERVALYSAITDGYTKGEVRSIHVMNKTNQFSYPCFICRQALSDLCDRDVVVTVYNNEGKTNTVLVSDLCTYPFDEENLR